MRPTNHSTGPGQSRPGRREVLLGAAAVALLAGCAATDGAAGDDPTPGTARQSPDVAIAVEAVGLLLGIRAVIAATIAAHPELREDLTGFDRAHRAHLDALSAAVPERVNPSPPATQHRVPVGVARAMAVATARETALRDRFLGLALRAESGPFARLLGTIAAGLSQRLAVAAG